MSTRPIVKGVGQISINVHDIEAAIRFYQEDLGLTLLFKLSNMAFLDCNGLQIVLSIAENEKFDHASSVFYFKVDDINDAYQSLLNRNITFLDTPHKVADNGQTETWLTFFYDPDHNVHALMSEVACPQ